MSRLIIVGLCGEEYDEALEILEQAKINFE